MNKKRLIVAWVRKNKQLIVAWMMGVLLSLVFIFADYTLQSGIKTVDSKFLRFPLTDIFRCGIPILIIGGLLIYTLRDKKKGDKPMIGNVPEWLNEGKPEKNKAESQLESSRREMYKALELYYTHVKYVITILFSLVTALFAIFGLYGRLSPHSHLLPASTIKFFVGITLSIFVPVITVFAIFIIRRYYEVYISSLIFALRVHLAVDMENTHPWFVRTIEQAKKWKEKVHSDNDFLKKRAWSPKDTFVLYSGIIVVLAILSFVCGLKVLGVF